MVHDFSQAEAPPDASWDEDVSPEPQSGDQPALVWVTVVPHVDDNEDLMDILEELFPHFDELEAPSEATALWSPDDLEATIEEELFSYSELPPVGATALCVSPTLMTSSQIFL